MDFKKSDFLLERREEGRRGIGRGPQRGSILYKKIRGNHGKMLTLLFFVLFFFTSLLEFI